MMSEESEKSEELIRAQEHVAEQPSSLAVVRYKVLIPVSFRGLLAVLYLFLSGHTYTHTHIHTYTQTSTHRMLARC